MPLSLLLALSPATPVPPANAPSPPLPADAFPAYVPPRASLLDDGGSGGTVETFDPVARAELMATRIPRFWRGTYRPFERGAAVQPALLRLDAVVPDGQMVVLRGRMQIAGVETPFQGTINAKSDQLDLVPLAGTLAPGLEAGGGFQGLQGLSLSGWDSPRFTFPGGRLQLIPGAPPAEEASAGEVIRGLW